MIIPAPKNCDPTLLSRPFAFSYFKKQIAPLGNCVTFTGPWNRARAGMSSAQALHFLWEIPRQLSFKGIEINWMLLPTIASHLCTITGKPTEIVDNVIRTYTTDRDQEFGVITCDVSSRMLMSTTIGHIALHIEPGDDCFPLSVGIPSLITGELQQQHVLREVAKNGVQAFYALTSKLFFTESILSDDI